MVSVEGAGGQHGNYGSALAAHPGKPQGRPDNGSGSQPMVQESAYPHSRAPGAPYPGWSHHSLPRWVSRYRDTNAIMPVNGQVERMNRTIKEATVKRYHYDSHAQLERHLNDFVDAYNFGRRLKTLKGLTPYEFICKAWTSSPERFILDPLQQMPGLNT